MLPPFRWSCLDAREVELFTLYTICTVVHNDPAVHQDLCWRCHPDCHYCKSSVSNSLSVFIVLPYLLLTPVLSHLYNTARKVRVLSYHAQYNWLVRFYRVYRNLWDNHTVRKSILRDITWKPETTWNIPRGITFYLLYFMLYRGKSITFWTVHATFLIVSNLTSAGCSPLSLFSSRNLEQTGRDR